MTKGYVLVRRPGHPLAGKRGYVLEHRLVWFEANGPIPVGMVVHHKNGNKADNRLANLELLTRSDHMREHYGDGLGVRNGLAESARACSRGHAKTPETWDEAKGTCRICARIYYARYRATHREQRAAACREWRRRRALASSGTAETPDAPEDEGLGLSKKTLARMRGETP